MIPSQYTDTDAAPFALVGELAETNERARLDPVFRDDAAGIAIFPEGRVVDWSRHLDRPARLSGSTALADPESFADFVLRYKRSGESVIFADKANGRLTAVLNAAPPAEEGDARAVAGHGDHRAVLALVTDSDWAEWERYDQALMPQDSFGELIDTLAHTMVTPDSARMLEIATTITGRQRIDFSSKTRLSTGEVSFRFETDTQMRAGKGATEVEIPESFVFAVPRWEGTPAVEVTARLRTKATEQGVRLGYRIIRKAAAVDLAFRSVVEQIAEQVGDEVPVFLGQPPA